MALIPNQNILRNQNNLKKIVILLGSVGWFEPPIPLLLYGDTAEIFVNRSTYFSSLEEKGKKIKINKERAVFPPPRNNFRILPSLSSSQQVVGVLELLALPRCYQGADQCQEHSRQG